MKEALIIGGGLAGASLAVRLAGAGRSVRLLEREAGPHDKVCGEFLSFEAEGYLRELGLDPEALGAVRIRQVEVARGRQRILTDLPFRALSLSRRILDEVLLARAVEAGATVERGRRVTAIQRVGSGFQAQVEGGGAFETDQLFLATGKHDVRGWRRPPGPQPDLIGFKQHWRLASAQAGGVERRVELHLFPGGYAGLEPVERDRANLCLVVRSRAFEAAGRSWSALLATLMRTCPSLAARLAGAESETAKPLAIASIPYGHVRRRSDGVWRLGDQAAVIPSFAGEGMSIALHSARLAADALLSGATAHAYQRTLARDVGRQVALATWVSQALVRPWSQAAGVTALQVAPAIVSLVATATRIPRGALPLKGDRVRLDSRCEEGFRLAVASGARGDDGQGAHNFAKSLPSARSAKPPPALMV